MYFLKNRFIETGSTGLLPVPVPVQVGPSTGSGTPVSVFKTMRAFLLPSRGSPGRSISRFSFPMAFIFYQLLLPPGPLAPSSHKTRCTLDGHPNG
jgi:hypothetical protein